MLNVRERNGNGKGRNGKREGRDGMETKEWPLTRGFTIAHTHTLTHLDSNCFLLLSTHIASFLFLGFVLFSKDNDGSLDA